MAIAGIEGLAQGFMQGMALKRQNDRQDVLDAQNLERFGMDKERFATQQAASAFELQNAQTNAANAATDRVRTLRLQSKQDATLANMQKLWSLGDNAEAIHSEVEKLHQANGEQGAYKRDAAGKIITDKSGVATWVNKDGSEVPTDAKGAKMSYWMAANPNEAAKNQLENDNTIAKEGREAKTAATKAATEHGYKMSELGEAGRQARLNIKPEKETPLSAADFKSFFGEDYEIGTDANGLTKMGNRINRALQNRFLTWASVNKRKATMSAYQDWVANDPAAQSLASPNKDIDMNGKGVLKGFPVTGLEEVNKADMANRPPLVVGNQGAVPKSLTIPRPVPTVSYENMPIKSVTKTAVKQGRGGGSYTYQEVLATRDMPIPPEGFKRKSLSERDPNFNVFVSNNYQD